MLRRIRSRKSCLIPLHLPRIADMGYGQPTFRDAETHGVGLDPITTTEQEAPGPLALTAHTKKPLHRT